jgi:hypothetical protein
VWTLALPCYCLAVYSEHDVHVTLLLTFLSMAVMSVTIPGSQHKRSLLINNSCDAAELCHHTPLLPPLLSLLLAVALPGLSVTLQQSSRWTATVTSRCDSFMLAWAGKGGEVAGKR